MNAKGINKDKIQSALNLVTFRLQHLQRPEKEEELLKNQEKTKKVIGAFPRDFGMDAWDWPQGVGLYGMMNLYKITGDQDIKLYIQQWFQRHIQMGLPVRNINTTCPLLTMVDLVESNEEYREICEDWAKWIMYEMPRTKENGFQHTTTKDAARGLLNMNENQIWIDTLFMTVLFLAKWGVYTDNEAYQNEAVHQYLIMLKYLYDKEAGLFYHAWTFDENKNFSKAFWCRGNCWYTASVLDFIEILGDKLSPPVKEILIDAYKAQVSALCEYQSESGLWHTVLDDPDSYEETSGSAGIVYGILKGLRSKVLTADHVEAAERAVNGILDKISSDGTVEGVSAGTPVGRGRDHYKGIMIAPMAYGQSLCIMALSEALQ
ncbi:glycoside hydrolase family 88/105 protein [Lacrimispora indolis]|uniref:glycoside hydrolase family 88/105 protein n=1 Tax=Lacrimispora indolis TaxID=69825 RepID=UPI00045E8448|nr:glycoside hydrolase family 88 protein [Lacrimispora indolis]